MCSQFDFLLIHNLSIHKFKISVFFDLTFCMKCHKNINEEFLIPLSFTLIIPLTYEK